MTAVRPAVTTCHCAVATTSAGPDAAIVALVGAPNSGKSTLFNALTGARTTVGNWPGTTVEVERYRPGPGFKVGFSIRF